MECQDRLVGTKMDPRGGAGVGGTGSHCCGLRFRGLWDLGRQGRTPPVAAGNRGYGAQEEAGGRLHRECCWSPGLLWGWGWGVPGVPLPTLSSPEGNEFMGTCSQSLQVNRSLPGPLGRAPRPGGEASAFTDPMLVGEVGPWVAGSWLTLSLGTHVLWVHYRGSRLPRLTALPAFDPIPVAVGLGPQKTHRGHEARGLPHCGCGTQHGPQGQEPGQRDAHVEGWWGEKGGGSGCRVHRAWI